MEDKSFYNKITWFSFAFSLFVIWIHSYNAELFLGRTEAMARIYRIEHWIGDGIGQIAVPGFFMISGYLFYRDFSWEKLRGKWNRRIHSVLVPYILWNFLYYLGYVIGTRLPWVNQVVGKGVVRFSLSASVDAIINYTYNYVFWYLYQLILLILLAPVLYLLLKRWWSRGIFLLSLWGMVVFDLRLPLVNVDAMLYYSTAASFALSEREGKGTITEERTNNTAETTVVRQNRFWFSLAMLAVSAAACQVGMSRGQAAYLVLCRILAVCGLWGLVPEEALPEAGELVHHNFFLYATHFAFVRFFNKAGARVLPSHPLIPLTLYLIMPALVLGVSAVLGKILRRHAPEIWIVLNGGR